MSDSDCLALPPPLSKETRLFLAEEFIAAYCRSDLARLGSLLSDDFRFEGPLFEAASKREYLECLEQDPPDPRSSYQLLHAYEEDGAVWLAYRFFKPGKSMLIAERCRFHGDKISEVTLVFDGEAVGDDA